MHPGFSVYAGPPAEAAELISLESLARYITRPALAMDALHKLDDGNLALQTPPDPRTGATSIMLGPLEWIHRITSYIPDPGRHCQRFYGAYSNRAFMVLQVIAAAIDSVGHVPRITSANAKTTQGELRAAVASYLAGILNLCWERTCRREVDEINAHALLQNSMKTRYRSKAV